MKFRYEFDIKRLPYQITHRQNLLLVGSCFTENIGEKLRRHKFRTMENPNGILFNPVSVAEAIHNYIHNKQYTQEQLFHYNEAWHSWQHHSRFSGLTVEEALDKINTSTQQAHDWLHTTGTLLITLGSSWLYTLTEEAPNAIKGNTAANNHKGPAAWFHKRLMSAEETVTLLDNLLQELFAFNHGLQVIFTISPVRHLREGAIENNRSKAVLIQAVHTLVEKYEAAWYFPAYELVIDDLRDYRFYAEDLAHPNYQATQYVWEKFIAACMDEPTRLLMKEIAEINLAHQHTPFNPASEQHKKFLAAYLEKTKVLQLQHPYLDFGEETNYFTSGKH